MDWKEFFKPTKGKLISAIIVTITGYSLLSLKKGQMRCEPCSQNVICSSNWPNLINQCGCCGISITNFAQQIFILFILPFISTYIIYSFVILIIDLIRKKFFT